MITTYKDFLNEGRVKRFFKYGGLGGELSYTQKKMRDAVRDWEKQVEEMNKKIKMLEDSKKKLEDTLLTSKMTDEEKEEFINKRKRIEERLKKKKEELSDKRKEFDPYGEEEWEDNFDKLKSDIEMEEFGDDDETYINLDRIETIEKAEKFLRSIADHANRKLNDFKEENRF